MAASFEPPSAAQQEYTSPAVTPRGTERPQYLSERTYGRTSGGHFRAHKPTYGVQQIWLLHSSPPAPRSKNIPRRPSRQGAPSVRSTSVSGLTAARVAVTFVHISRHMECSKYGCFIRAPQRRAARIYLAGRHAKGHRASAVPQ